MQGNLELCRTGLSTPQTGCVVSPYWYQALHGLECLAGAGLSKVPFLKFLLRQNSIKVHVRILGLGLRLGLIITLNLHD